MDPNTGLVTWASTTLPTTKDYYDVIVTASIGGFGASSVSQLLRVYVDKTGPDAPDLSSSTGAQLTASTYVNATEAAAGKSIAADIQVPTSADIGRITITLGGILAGDQLVLDGATSHSLGSNFDSLSNSSGVTLGGVAGVKYTYDATSHVLTLSPNTGGAFTTADIDNIVAAVKFKTTAADGARTASIQYVDLAGNTSAVATSTLTVDRTTPSAVDLNSAANTQATDQQYINASEATTGKSIAVDLQAPIDTDISTVTIQFAGLDTANDKLLLEGTVAKAFNAISAATNVTIGGVAGLNYTYTPATGVLTITKNGGGALAPADIDAVVTAIKLQTTSSAMQGNRTATISYTDLAGNTNSSSGAAITTITVDSVAVSANLTVSSVEADATTARGTDQADRFLGNSENNVVLKVDSTAFGTASALKAGDVITLQVKDVAASTAAGKDVFVDLVHTTAGTGYAVGDKYTYTVTTDDVASGDGVGKAAYMQVQKADLKSGLTSTVNDIRAHVVDKAGNAADTGVLSITVQAPIKLTLDSTVTALEVNSQIVLKSSQALATAAHKKITFTDNGGAGFAGENTNHTFFVYADDTRYVTISGDKIIIKTPWDFDFANNYKITVEAGAFLTAPDKASDAPALETAEVTTPDNVHFSTVAVGTDFANAVQGQVMNTDGTVSNGKKWFAVDDTTSNPLDLSSGGYAMVFKDDASAGQNPSVNDGVATSKNIKVVVNNFGADDQIYADDQNNNLANLNDKQSTQVIDYATPNQKTLHFDPLNSGPGNEGATFTLNTGLSTQDVLDRLNISNSAATPTPITAIARVNASNAVVSSNQVGASTTDADPLRIKISAAVKTGDTVQMVYIDASGNIQNIGSPYTALAADQTNGYVTLSLTHTQLLSLPHQEGYNQVFAKLTNTSGGINYSPLLGGDSGIYLDTVAPTPTLDVKSGQDNHISNAETAVDLIVSASHLSVGDVLILKLGTTQLGTWTVTAANFGTDATFNVPASKLNYGPNTLSVTSTDALGNVGSSTAVITKDEYVDYTGILGLGPVVNGNDLRVTAYDSAGNILAQSTDPITASGGYTLKINKSYTGAITLRVSSTGALSDYRDEATAQAVDMGSSASIAAVVVADGSSKTANISTLTDLVARQLSFGNVVAASAAQINAYNLQLAKLLIDPATTTDITSWLPTFVVDASGASTVTATNKYGQLLAQISSQAVANGASMDTIQTELANAITWSWSAATATATPSLSGNLAKQVVLLCKVAQAAALDTGASASLYLTAADFATYGFTAISGLSAARQTDFIHRIVATSNTGSELDTLAELQNLVNKEVALAKIQDYAASKTNPTPTLEDYAAAGMTGVTAQNLAAVNLRFVGNTAVSSTTAPDDALIQTTVDVGVANQTAAVTKIAAYASNGNTKPVLDDYTKAGATGVTADNLDAINAKVDALASLATLADIQPTVSSAIHSYTQPLLAIRAYIRDGLAYTAPTASTYFDAGLTGIDTADEISSANYYLNAVLADADADLADAVIASKLTQQQTALAKINAYAASSANTAPTVGDYIAAGITKATSNNRTSLNILVDGASSIATAADLAALLASVVAGVPSLLSIVRGGTSVSNATYQTDSYLNAAELASGQTAQFTITFDRSVTGLTAANFGLTDANGNTILGATPTLTLTSADGGAGKVWNIVVGNINGITSSSLHLNLINNTGVIDSISGAALFNATYTAGQSYTIDPSNTLVVSAAAGSDLILDNTESAANIYVAPDTLSVGDVLSITKADGTQIGSSITVTAAMLGTGVTFSVPKTSLVTGANVLTVHSTDIAGNAGTSSVTVNVSEYVTLTGTLGLPSKILASNDLSVCAYDSAGVLIGKGTLDAATGTYSLALLKTQTGVVTLKIASQGNAKDYWDEANAAQTDLGGATFAATIVANGLNQTANITLLTDLATSLIRGIAATPSSAQVSAVNLALTKLLLNPSSNTDITAYTPDFTTDPLGASTVNTATMYGQLMAQLVQQVKEKSSSLVVVLSQMASGITFDGTTATLNSPFAKEVFLLAKTQMAASLATGANASAYLSVQDLIDNGITGISTLTTTRKADLIARIVATSDDGSQVDTLTKVQALANKVIALAKIQDYADAGGVPPVLADYAAAAVTGVTADNLAAVNVRIYIADAMGTSSDSLIQSLANAGIAAYTAALLKIANYAKDATNPKPTLDDYVDAGVTGINATNLFAVNTKVDAVDQSGADTKAKIQTLVNAGAVDCASAIAVIKAYMQASAAAAAPDLATYQHANLANFTSTAQADNANYLISHNLSGQTLTDTQLASKLSDQVAAINAINTYAATGGTAPTTTTYANAGFTQVQSANLSDINARVNSATSLDTTTALLGILRAIDLDRSKLDIQATSAITLNASTALSATAIFAGVAKTYVDADIVSIKIAAGGTALDGTSDKFVFEGITKAIDTQALTGSNVTINTVSGVNWSYNVAHQLIFTKSDGSTFTAAQAQLIEQAVKFQTKSTTTQGQRTFTLLHLSADGAVSAAATNTVVVDTTSPAVDTYNTALGAAGQFLFPGANITDTGASYNRIVAQFNTAATDYGVAITYAANLDVLTLSESVKSLVNTTWNATTGTLTITAASGVDWTLSQTQQILQAIQYASLDAMVLNPNVERHINVSVSDTTNANSVSLLKTVALLPSVDLHSAQLDIATSKITLNFEAALTGTPQIADFSDLKLDGVAANLSGVSLSGSSLLLSLASALTSDAVVSFNYTPNASAANHIQSAGASLSEFAFLQDKAANNNTALAGTAGKHNIIIGNGGADTMTGAELSDTFVFGLGTTGISHVTNFSISQGDKLDLSKLISSYTSTYGTNGLSKYLNLSTVNSGHDLQLQIDKDGLGNFTTGLDATVILTDVGTTATNAGTANTSADLTDYLLKHSAVVL